MSLHKIPGGGGGDPELSIDVATFNDIVGRHHNLFNFPWKDSILSQSVHKVKPPCDEHVLCEDEVLLREGPEV